MFRGSFIEKNRYNSGEIHQKQDLFCGLTCFTMLTLVVMNNITDHD